MTHIRCPSRQAKNRVGPIASGYPRCARCKTPLPWVVDADARTFAEQTNVSLPVLVALRGGREVDRIVGALPPAALEARLRPLIA